MLRLKVPEKLPFPSHMLFQTSGKRFSSIKLIKNKIVHQLHASGNKGAQFTKVLKYQQKIFCIEQNND